MNGANEANEAKPERLSRKKMIGYGIASISDSGPYNFVLSYFILYLTTVVGLSADKAGTISAIIILFDAISGVLIGYISDNTVSKHGRRRLYMNLAAAPLFAGLIVMFMRLPVGMSAQEGIYIVAGLLFWLGFSAYYTPYSALGAELTDDYHERSVLRTYARYFGLSGNFIGSVFPLLIISGLMSAGLGESTSWTVMAAIVAAVSSASILITTRSMKGMEREVSPDEAQKITPKSIVSMMKDYVSILALKPFKYIIGIIASFIVANTFFNSTVVFFTRYELGIQDNLASTVFLVSMIANAAYTPITGSAAVKYGKKAVVAFCMIFSGIGSLIFFAVGISSVPMLYAFVCVFAVAYSCFWQLINSVLYDITELAEFKFGKHMEGSITSVYGFTFTAFTSAASQVLGFALKFDMFKASFMLIPGVCLVIAGLFTCSYPLNQKRFDKLKLALAAKKAGEEPDISGLEKIV